MGFTDSQSHSASVFLLCSYSFLSSLVFSSCCRSSLRDAVTFSSPGKKCFFFVVVVVCSRVSCHLRGVALVLDSAECELLSNIGSLHGSSHMFARWRFEHSTKLL